MKKKTKGIAIIAVLTMIIVLVVLTTSLILITKEHLFQTASYYDKSVAQNLAEAAVSEAIMKLKSSAIWGKNGTDYLLMEASQKTGLGISLPSSNSVINYNVKGLYYITFDQSAGIPYSYNNLGGDSAQGLGKGWVESGPKRDIPAGTADIIVNVAVGPVVKRLQVFVNISAGGPVPVMPTIGGQAKFQFEDGGGNPGKFEMFCIDPNGAPSSDPPNFHADSNDPSYGINIMGDLSNVNLYGGNFSSQGKIVNNGGGADLKNGSTYITDQRSVPTIDFSQLATDPNATKIIGNTTIEFTGASDPKISYNGTYYPSGTEIKPGLFYVKDITTGNKPTIIIKKDIEISGDFNLDMVNLVFDPAASTPPYLYLKDGGNLKSGGGGVGGCGNMSGKGKLYVEGTVNVNPMGSQGGYIDTGAGGNISLYAKGDINFGKTSDIPESVTYYGLIYTEGNLYIKTQGGDIKFSGSTLIKNNMTLLANMGAGNPGSIIFGIDKNIIPPTSGSGGKATVFFWQDF